MSERHGCIILGGLLFPIFYTYSLKKSSGDTTECILGMIFVTWCILKLDFYVTLWSTCLILIVYNYIIHIGRKMISWIWLVGDIAMISDFSDHIQSNCFFYH